MSASHQVRQCTNEACRLRFPLQSNQLPANRCPLCGCPTTVCVPIQTTGEPLGRPPNPPPRTFPLAVLVDNVRSLFNVGSIFRSADGAGFAHLYLCGITPTPDNPKLAKTALGAEQVVPWSRHNNSLDCAHALIGDGSTLWALEEAPTAPSLFTVPLPTALPLVLVVGNEVTGVDPGLIACCAQVVALPMYGAKRSLNVATAFGAAAVVLAQRLLDE